MTSRQSSLVVSRLLLLAACAALRLPARGAGGVPSSAAGYIFTVPRLTNHIHGTVMDSTNAYRVIRSEDVDWLREAFAERQALEFGSTHPRAGVGAQVKRYDKPDATTLWNGWPRGSDSGWLDPDTPLLAGARLYTYGAKVTNTCVEVVYTNLVTNAISTIEMPMANGSVSVWTNRWSATLNARADQIATNVHAMTALDYCWAGNGVFGGYTNTPRRAFGWPTYSGLIPPSIGEITNAWAALRGTGRLADADEDFANSTLTIDESAYGGNGSQTFHQTNSLTDVLGGIRYDLSTGCQTNGYWSSSVEYSLPFTADIPTRFDSSLVTTGGANRVSIEAAFVQLNFAYFFHDARHPSADYAVQTNAIVRLVEPSLDTSGPIARVRVPVDAKALCSAVATEAGCPPVPSAGVMYAAPNGEYHSWHIDSDRCVIIYRITPSVKLPDW